MNVCLNSIARQKYFTMQLNIQESAAKVSGTLTLKLVNQATLLSDIIFFFRNTKWLRRLSSLCLDNKGQFGTRPIKYNKRYNKQPNLRYLLYLFFFFKASCVTYTPRFHPPQFQTWHSKVVSQSAPHIFIRDTAINRHPQEKTKTKKKTTTKLVANKFKCQWLVSDINSVEHRFSRADDRIDEGEGVRRLSSFLSLTVVHEWPGSSGEQKHSVTATADALPSHIRDSNLNTVKKKNGLPAIFVAQTSFGMGECLMNENLKPRHAALPNAKDTDSDSAV